VVGIDQAEPPDAKCWRRFPQQTRALLAAAVGASKSTAAQCGKPLAEDKAAHATMMGYCDCHPSALFWMVLSGVAVIAADDAVTQMTHFPI